MLHLKNTEFELLPEQNIIKAGEYASLVKAEEIIALAEAKAKRIEDEAKQAYEEEKTRGLQEGMNEGKEKMTEHMIRYVQKTVEQLDHYENTVVDMVMSAMKQVLGDMDDKEIITRVVNKALNLVKSQPKVILRVSPAQVEVIDAELKDILKKYPSIQFIDVQRDDRLNLGDCILETDMGVIDARIDLQLESIRKTLEKLVK